MFSDRGGRVAWVAFVSSTYWAGIWVYFEYLVFIVGAERLSVASMCGCRHAGLWADELEHGLRSFARADMSVDIKWAELTVVQQEFATALGYTAGENSTIALNAP